MLAAQNKNLLSWSTKTLSYAGRVQLIQSVIVSTANFWCSAFKLPCRCLDEIERMCKAFLWSGSPHQTTRAKVAWEDLCLPKREGGLGIRKLRDSSKVFLLKLIWRLYANAGTLWVAWTRRYLLRHSSFWDIPVKTNRGSWMWRKILQLRPLAATLIRMEVKNGKETYFWLDRWADTDPLIDLIDEQGMKQLGIARNAKVADVVDLNGWRFRRTRTLQTQELARRIQMNDPPDLNAGPDFPLWHQGNGVFENKFTTKKTWQLIRNPGDLVPWHKIVWFPQAIPKQSFIAWLALKDRLSTGDHTKQWGEIQSCRFCGERDETRDHLYLACPYTYTVWTSLAGQLLGSRINPDWTITINSLIRNRLSRIDSTLAKMIFQAVVYWVWRERNARKHQHTCTPPATITHMINTEIHTRLLAMQVGTSDSTNAMAERWATLNQSPTP